MIRNLIFIATAAVALAFVIYRDFTPDSSVLTIEVRRPESNEVVFLVDGLDTRASNLVSAISAHLEEVPSYVDDLGTHPDIEIRIVASSNIEYGAFYPVLEACMECGIHLVTLVCGERSAPILIFDPGDLHRGPASNPPLILAHPPRIKLLWYKKDSDNWTDSGVGRSVLKVKDRTFEIKRKGPQPVQDYNALKKYLKPVVQNYLPTMSYPSLYVEIWPHWNTPYSAVVECACAADECGTVDSYITAPWRYRDWNMSYDDTESNPKYLKYMRQVGLISNRRIKWNFHSYEGYEDEKTGHWIEHHEAFKENLFGRLLMYLDSRDNRRRKLGARLLKSYFGNDFGYSANAPRGERVQAVSSIKSWWQENKTGLVFDQTDIKFIKKDKDK